MLDKQSIIKRAKELGKNIPKGFLYYNVFKDNQDKMEHVLFEIAQQSNDEESKKCMINAVGAELVEMSITMYPNAKVGDKYPEIT